MKVIFLDIDGILNNEYKIRRNGFDSIDQVFVERLKNIVVATKAELVLSSSWRQNEYDFNLVRQALAVQNLTIFDATIMLSGFDDIRCDEIIEWLSRHDVEKFAILDDDNDAGIKLRHSFFKADFSVGLTDKIAAQIIEHLGTYYDTKHNIPAM